MTSEQDANLAPPPRQSTGPTPSQKTDFPPLKLSQHSELQGHPTKSDYIIKTPKKARKLANPYSIRKAPKEDKIRIGTTAELISILKEYIPIIIGHDPNKQTETWYRLWTSWKTTGTLEPDITIPALATLVNLPEERQRDIKNVTLHILDILPILQKYIRMPWKTKNEHPILYLTKPTIVATNTAIRSAETPLKSNKAKTSDAPAEANKPMPAADGSTDPEPVKPCAKDINPFAPLADTDDISILGSAIEELTDSETMAPIEELTTPEVSTTTTPTNLNNEMELAHNTFEDVLRNMMGVEIPQDKEEGGETNATTTNIAPAMPPNIKESTPELQKANTTTLTRLTLTDVEKYWEAKTTDFNDKI